MTDWIPTRTASRKDQGELPAIDEEARKGLHPPGPFALLLDDADGIAVAHHRGARVITLSPSLRPLRMVTPRSLRRPFQLHGGAPCSRHDNIPRPGPRAHRSARSRARIGRRSGPNTAGSRNDDFCHLAERSPRACRLYFDHEDAGLRTLGSTRKTLPASGSRPRSSHRRIARRELRDFHDVMDASTMMPVRASPTDSTA